MALGRDTGAAFCIDCYGHLGECGFDEHRVGNNANVGAKSNQFNAFKIVGLLQKVDKCSRNLPVEHCIKGTDGWQIHPSLEALRKTEAIDKPTFGSTALVHLLQKANDLESVELIGLCTDICVISNAMLIKAAFPEIPVTVDAKCCAGVTPESHKNALDAMKMCQIKIVNE